jgi:integral membrane protein
VRQRDAAGELRRENATATLYPVDIGSVVSAGTGLASNLTASARAALERLRLVGTIEGVSFLVLLCVAMPLKYAAGMPMAVKVVGWAHGVLFILFVASLWAARKEARLPARLSAMVFLAALLPFGPFVIDRRLEQFVKAPPAR